MKNIVSKFPAIIKKISPPQEKGLPQRFERKFFIVPKNFGLALSLLRQFCRADREYPDSTVSSLYFDTTDLEQYEKSDSGDYNKDKIRIRWYDEESLTGETVPVFIELKTRHGFASSKQRKKLIIPLKDIQLPALRKGIIAGTELFGIINGFGYFPEMPLQPVIKISYRRYRFNEISTGTRVSLDYNIRSTMIVPELGKKERELRLEGAVIEVKGPSMELPVTLQHMNILDTDWTRFSKYSNCIDSHLADLSSVARFSPSGKIV